MLECHMTTFFTVSDAPQPVEYMWLCFLVEIRRSSTSHSADFRTTTVLWISHFLLFCKEKQTRWRWWKWWPLSSEIHCCQWAPVKDNFTTVIPQPAVQMCCGTQTQVEFTFVCAGSNERGEQVQLSSTTSHTSVHLLVCPAQVLIICSHQRATAPSAGPRRHHFQSLYCGATLVSQTLKLSLQKYL